MIPDSAALYVFETPKRVKTDRIERDGTQVHEGGFVRAEAWETRNLELSGWPVKLTCYRIGASHVAEVESVTTGSTIATAIAPTPEKALKEVLEISEARLRCTRIGDAGLTVGG